jgi:hypothetical protein
MGVGIAPAGPPPPPAPGREPGAHLSQNRADSGVNTQRLGFFFKAGTGVFVPFSAAYTRRLMPVNRALLRAGSCKLQELRAGSLRAESSPEPGARSPGVRVPCALFSFCFLRLQRPEAKHHHHPQLAQRCSSAACAAFRVPRSVPATISAVER